MKTETLSHVMFDLETLGVHDGAAVVQIGAVLFDPWAGEAGMISTPEGGFFRRVNITQEPDRLGTLDGDTLVWWARQERAARDQVFDCAGEDDIYQVLGHFQLWVQEAAPEHVWSATQFDWTLLRQAYRRCDTQFPFSRHTARCWPTLRAFGRAGGIEEPLFGGTPHVAIHDAQHQAIWATNIIRGLGLKI